MKRTAKRIVLFLLSCVAVLVIALCAAGLLYEHDIRIPDGRGGRHVEIDGIKLRVLQEGSGRDVLMIHGSPGMIEDFDLQARELQREFRVTRYDRPGHGFSEDSGSYSFDYNARIAAALIEQLGLERTIVVGHSYGGATALALAALKPPRVSALVVLDSAVYTNIRPVNPLFRWLRLPAFGTGLARAMRGTTRARVTESLTTEFKAGPPPNGFSALRSDVFSEPKVVHAIANEHSTSSDELGRQSPRYPAIDVPVFIVSQRDDAARRAAAERLQSEVAGSEVVLVSPSGHFVQVEQAAAVTDVIRRAAGS